MNFICIFYYPSVKWLDAGAILVMRAMMSPHVSNQLAKSFNNCHFLLRSSAPDTVQTIE
jgi:hypothetical protein